MPTRNYIAVADRAPGEAMWSIVFPDFPGVTSAAAEFADVPQQACDALATAVEDIIAEGERLPALGLGAGARVNPTISTIEGAPR